MGKKTGVGGNSRKTRRSIKRARYNGSFETRYGMKRSKWVDWKNSHSGVEVDTKRKKALV